ncbi:hypothetical protein [Xenorhabdus koppenhoeferi]|uniref:Uncharacterized protein n=1 Tax=Xenorhabdus koppenhoeferi TaxID=351659 RepID=A0A1I7J0V1_9GAMM|nr:hypothetical protein [Xenorhabdus koppenhoeferi]CEE91898.1 hypothetical protein XNA1_2470005 [Xenorhabdus nematophila str. Anatoliense]SFU78836.1 hypothetical protein SAMN05421784_1268 [Xenorhabdus koppenhoeferi]
MTSSEQQKLAVILKLADERYGVNNGSREKVEFTLSQSVTAGVSVNYYVTWDIGLTEGWDSIIFGFERLRERATLRV